MQIVAVVVLFLTCIEVGGRRVRHENSSLQGIDEPGQQRVVKCKNGPYARQQRIHSICPLWWHEWTRYHAHAYGVSSLFYSLLLALVSGREARCSCSLPKKMPRHRGRVAANIVDIAPPLAKQDIREVLRDLKDDFMQIMHRQPDWSRFADDFAIVDRRGSKIREGESLVNVKLLLQQIRQARSKFMSRDRIRFKEQGVQTRRGWCNAQWHVRLSSVNYSHWDIDQNAVVNIFAMTSFRMNAVGKIDRMRIDSLYVNRTEYKLLLNKMLEREFEDDLDSDEFDTSFASVTRWPALKLYTFGECAFSFNRTEERVKSKGFRVSYDEDPVPTVLGQAIGFSHHTMVPLVNFTIPIPEKNCIDDDVDIVIANARSDDLGEEDELQDASSPVASSFTRLAVLDNFLSTFKDRDKLDEIALERDDEEARPDEDSSDEDISMRTRRGIPLLDMARNKASNDRKMMLALANRSSQLVFPNRSLRMVLEMLQVKAREQVERQVRKLPKQAWKKLISKGTKERHSMQNYVALTRRRFVENSEGKTNENKEMYRMSLLTQRISSLDADDTESIQSAVDSLNGEFNPRRPRQHLFHSLTSVMSLKFYTKSRAFSKALNNGLSKRLGYEKIGRKGNAHNVHFLKEGSNGYLCFEGTRNVATWLDVHFAFKRYDPDAQPVPLADTVDDARWKIIEAGYLYNCHTGFCGSLKALVSDEQFPFLAKQIAGLRSLSVVGHSFGGSLASMLVMSAQAVKESQKRKFNLWRYIPIVRRFGRKANPSTKSDHPITPPILNHDQDLIIEELSLEQKAFLQERLRIKKKLSEDRLKASDWDIQMIEVADIRDLIECCNAAGLSHDGSKASLFLRLKNFVLSSEGISILAQKRQLRSVLQLKDVVSDEDLASFDWEIKLVSSIKKGDLQKLCKERGLPLSRSQSNADMFFMLKGNISSEVEELSIQQRKSLRTGLQLDDKVSDEDLTKLGWEVAIISTTTLRELQKCCREHGLAMKGSKADMLLRIKKFVLEAAQKKNFNLKKEFRSDLDLCEKVSDVDLASVNWDIHIIDMCPERHLRRLCKEQCLPQKGSRSDLFLRLKDFMYQVGRFTEF